MRIIEEIINDILIINAYADDGKVFAYKSTGEKLGKGKCNHIVCDNVKQLENYIEVEFEKEK